MSEVLQTSEAQQQPELVEEQQIGGSPAARQVNDLLRALSRSARAFTLYDPQNEAIRRFLADFRDRLQQATASVGAINLEVRPFELLFETPNASPEVVYREEDRERSLAYRLFRDGVRKLSILPTVTWDEQLRLLEILSVRYVGVRQQEDDLVTLLTKAGFKGITFEAVEGFVAQHDEEDAPPPPLDPADRVKAPSDFDLPGPQPLAPRGFNYREIPPQYLSAVQAEETPETVPARALGLVAWLLRAVADPAQPIALADALPVIAEVRDYLVADRQLRALLALVRRLLDVGEPSEPFRALVKELQAEPQRAQLFEAAEPGAPTPPELPLLFEAIGGDALPFLLERLEVDEARRPHARALLAPLARSRAQEMVDRLAEAPTAVASELLVVLMQAAPEQALAAASKVIEHPDESIQLELVRMLGGAPRGSETTGLLMRALASPYESVRICAMQQAAARREVRLFDPLVRRAEDPTLSIREAATIGETMASLTPSTAKNLFVEWSQPKGGLLRRMVEAPGKRRVHYVAASGFGALPGEEAEQLVRELSARADAELKQHCVAVMVKRRKEGRGRG